jgi:AraC-like DNA-binding protein
VRQCGDSHRPAWSLASRKLLDYLLVYIADGRGRFAVGGREYEAEPGDLFWIPPDTLHAMEGYAPGMHCPYVHFDLLYRAEHSHWDFSIPGGMTELPPEFARLMHPRLQHAMLDSLPYRIRGHTNRRVGQLIQDVCMEAARAQPFAALKMSGLVTEAIAEILRGQERLGGEYMAHIPLLEKTAGLMIRECASALTVQHLARQCQLSVSHFRHLFTRHYGCSPRTYLRRARLQKAKELMVSTAMTLTEIADRLGFETVHSLSRAFRDEVGLSPSEFRHCATVRTRVEGRSAPYKC